jgi:UDP:flavonoid glycosyltransferase YjiC (YdhE family)
MQNVFLATEADEGMGHIAPWRDFVRLALHKGYQVHMAAPDVGQLERLLGDDLGVNVWQAPRLRRDAGAAYANPKSWPELLLHLGYGDVAQLSGVVKAWINLLRSSRASVVIADYAPSIQLAARVLGLPVIEAGGGFCVPPLSPVQCFPGVEGQNPAVAKNAEASLCSTFNAVLHKLGSADVLSSLAEYASWPAHRVVLSSPDLDHYGERADVRYLGLLGLSQISAQSTRNSPDAGSASAPVCVVGYLKPGTPGLPLLIDQLAEAGVDARLFVLGADPSSGRGKVKVTSQPLDFAKEFAAADIYFSNGGLNGVGQALHQGCWPVVVPMQAEQVAMARTLVRRKLGAVWLPGVLSPDQLKRMLSVERSDAYVPSAARKAETILLRLLGDLVAQSSSTSYPANSAQPRLSDEEERQCTH